MNTILEVSKTDRKYAGWLWTLKLFGKKYFEWTDETNPSPEAWKHFYDEGINPAEALKIDLQNQLK